MARARAHAGHVCAGHHALLHRVRSAADTVRPAHAHGSLAALCRPHSKKCVYACECGPGRACVEVLYAFCLCFVGLPTSQHEVCARVRVRGLRACVEAANACDLKSGGARCGVGMVLCRLVACEMVGAIRCASTVVNGLRSDPRSLSRRGRHASGWVSAGYRVCMICNLWVGSLTDLLCGPLLFLQYSPRPPYHRSSCCEQRRSRCTRRTIMVWNQTSTRNAWPCCLSPLFASLRSMRMLSTWVFRVCSSQTWTLTLLRQALAGRARRTPSIRRTFLGRVMMRILEVKHTHADIAVALCLPAYAHTQKSSRVSERWCGWAACGHYGAGLCRRCGETSPSLVCVGFGAVHRSACELDCLGRSHAHGLGHLIRALGRG